LFSFSVLTMLFYDYTLEESLFESSSALGTVGLSTGVTNPSMPLFVKVMFIINMWAGRLEILPVIALLLKIFDWK